MACSREEKSQKVSITYVSRPGLQFETDYPITNNALGNICFHRISHNVQLQKDTGFQP